MQKPVGDRLLPDKTFNELVLTDRRVPLLNNAILESEIPLGNVRQAVSRVIKKPLSLVALMIDKTDGESKSFLFMDGSEAEEWAHAINRMTRQTDSTNRSN